MTVEHQNWVQLCRVLSSMSQSQYDEQALFQIAESVLPTNDLLSPREVESLLETFLDKVQQLPKVTHD